MNRVRLNSVALIFVALAAVVWLGVHFAPHRALVTTIDIAAPPARAWDVLTDTASYPAWNPHMRLEGDLVRGATIEHTETSGGSSMVFRPTVLVLRPARELRWLGHLVLPGLFDAEHYFLLSPTATGTHFTQGENFGGLAMWVYDPASLLPLFTDMNQALKRRAEQQPAPPAPPSQPR